MGKYCRKVGYLYADFCKSAECAGCVKAIISAREMRVCLCLTGKPLKGGESGLYLLQQTANGPSTFLLDEFLIRPDVREYCFQYCLEKTELPCGQIVGFLVLSKETALACSFDGRELCGAVWMPASKKEKGEERAGGETENLLEKHLLEQEKNCLKDAKELDSCAEYPLSLCVEELFRKRHRMQPFLQNEFSCCVRISLSDLRLLQDAGNFGPGNSFLCHSYYRYRHLLLARKPGAEPDNWEVWLLAPGIGNGRERQMSALYGFTIFRSIHGRHCTVGYGYWGMRLLFGAQTLPEFPEESL